jgi:hypothetical protein
MFNNMGAILVDLIASTAMTAAIGIAIVLLWGKEKTT